MIGIRINGVTATSEACAMVMQTAVSAGHTHGIGYWAEVLDLTGGPLPLLVIRDLEIDDVKAQSTFKLTTVEIADAINKMVTDPDGTDSAGWTAQLLDHDFCDGPLADVIVQVACHGKVLYA